MSGNVEKERAEARRREMEEIGEADSNRLHGSMNDSERSQNKQENQQPNLATGRRDGDPGGSTSQADTSTSGSKRHASAGAGPSEPTPTTLEREGKRATSLPDDEDQG